jgi:hypothetical protein
MDVALLSKLAVHHRAAGLAASRLLCHAPIVSAVSGGMSSLAMVSELSCPQVGRSGRRFIAGVVIIRRLFQPLCEVLHHGSEAGSLLVIQLACRQCDF